MRYQVLTP